MISRGVLFSLTLSFAVAIAAPSDNPFPKPPPSPSPVDPGAVLNLTPEMYYVVESKSDAVLRAHPAGLVKVTRETGPIRLRGKFAEGVGAVETRKYEGPTVYIVEAVPGAKGRLELDLIPLGLKAETEIVTATVDVNGGTGPQPPPKPVNPVEPPAPVTSFRVILIYESADNLTAAEKAVVYGKAVEDWMTANCTGGKSGWRRKDKDAGADPDATFAPLWAAVKPKVTATPCVAVERNGKVDIIAIEPTPAKMVAVLNSYLGK